MKRKLRENVNQDKVIKIVREIIKKTSKEEFNGIEIFVLTLLIQQHIKENIEGMDEFISHFQNTQLGNETKKTNLNYIG